jgi:predicted ester cyclase
MSEITSLDEFKQFEQTLHKSFSEGQVTYEIMIAEGDIVAAYATFTGVNTGPLGEVEATGKSVHVKFLAMFRIETAKIAEIWVEWDNVSRLAQLGLSPTPGAQDLD